MHSLFRQGLGVGLSTWALLGLAVLPARIGVAMRIRGGSLFDRVTRAAAGATLDLSTVIVPVGVTLLAVGVLLVAVLPDSQRRFGRHLGAPLLAIPVGFVLYALTVIEQEVKAERGSFSTMNELVIAASEASFVAGSAGFFRYERIWVPALVNGGLAMLVVLSRFRAFRAEGDAPAQPWHRWAMGWAVTLMVGMVLMPVAVTLAAWASARLSPAALGDPLATVVETTFDLLQNKPGARPSELLFQLEANEADAVVGARRLGWPAVASGAHPYARPLDHQHEPPSQGTALLEALNRVSTALFDADERPVAVFQFSLESFRGDDLHSLNAAAPSGLAPFVNGLYEAAHQRTAAVLASSKTYQAGVRTAQGLAAMTCGLGTLPYNLSIIRDLDAFPLRCAPDVLSSAGFQGSFFYGSDAEFDHMSRFLLDHGFSAVVSQPDFPKDKPKGAWSGLTDLVVFEEAVRRASQRQTSSQFSLVMSLSNHSPYTVPEDIPTVVGERVGRATADSRNRATPDDRRRLLTYSYTDFALERFFAQLEASELSARSMVVVAADHSTGEDYVWGPETDDHETDDAKARVPFLIVIPQAFVDRSRSKPALMKALAEAQTLLEATPLSQNDIPTLMLALLAAHPALRTLAPADRWHTLGGQVTSPWFQPGERRDAFLVGINGVDELYVLDRQGKRVGSYEDAVFLKTRGDSTRVTPTLRPIAATLIETLRRSSASKPTAAPSSNFEQ